MTQTLSLSALALTLTDYPGEADYNAAHAFLAGQAMLPGANGHDAVRIRTNTEKG